MISMLVSEGVEQEMELLIETAKEIVAKSGDERLEFLKVTEEHTLDEFLQREKIDAAIVDVTTESGVMVAKQLRKQYPEIEILIISDTTVSPIVYLNPEVRAASLLLRPFQTDMMQDTLMKFLELFEEESMENECFLFDQKGERRRIPYQKIYYMEAREKRVYARLENIEYGITDTIEHLAGILPKEFIRCHRSYIVNYIYIERVRYAENFILLRGSHILPLSRSYKAALKEVMSNA